MLAPEEMESLRGVARASLQGTCDVVRKVHQKQPNGSWKDVPTTIASAVPCRKVPTGQTPEERILLADTTASSRGVATFILDGSLSVYKDDILHYPSGVGGKDYGVIGVLVRTGGEYMRAMVYDDSAGPAA